MLRNIALAFTLVAGCGGPLPGLSDDLPDATRVAIRDATPPIDATPAADATRARDAIQAEDATACPNPACGCHKQFCCVSPDGPYCATGLTCTAMGSLLVCL